MEEEVEEEEEEVEEEEVEEKEVEEEVEEEEVEEEREMVEEEEMEEVEEEEEEEEEEVEEEEVKEEEEEEVEEEEVKEEEEEEEVEEVEEEVEEMEEEMEVKCIRKCSTKTNQRSVSYAALISTTATRSFHTSSYTLFKYYITWSTCTRLCDKASLTRNFFSFFLIYFSCEYFVFSLKVVLCSTTVPTSDCVGDKDTRDVMINKKTTALTRQLHNIYNN